MTASPIADELEYNVRLAETIRLREAERDLYAAALKIAANACGRPVGEFVVEARVAMTRPTT